MIEKNKLIKQQVCVSKAAWAFLFLLLNSYIP